MTQIELETQTEMDVDPSVKMWAEAYTNSISTTLRWIGNLALQQDHQYPAHA
jgi:hypothetical protein